MSFVGSSKNWGEQSCARLCQIVMEANDGMAQQIIENRTDLLDLLPLEQLDCVDDFGLTLPYQAVYYDRPDMIKYLVKRGIDMNKPCDGLNFGTPMFYAVNMGRVAVMEALHLCGCSVLNPCDKYLNLMPEYHAIRTDNPLVSEKITYIKNADLRAAMLWKRNYLRFKCQKKYRIQRAAIILIQKIIRGSLVRFRNWRKIHVKTSKKVKSPVVADDNSVLDGEGSSVLEGGGSSVHQGSTSEHDSGAGDNDGDEQDGGEDEQQLDEDAEEGSVEGGASVGGGKSVRSTNSAMS